MSQPDRLATAEWANPAEVAAEHPFQPGAFWLGRSPAEPSVPLGYVDDRHVCLVSGSRGGKGTSVIINNLCLWEGSLVVIDPKGENATVTAARRGPGSEFCEGMGQAVRVLDPFEAATVDPSLRGQFNPLEHIDPDSELAPDEVGRIAEALVVKSHGNDPYWDESGRSMLKTIILHVLTSPHFKGHRNLITVRRLITHGDERFYAEMEKNPDLVKEGKKPVSPRELLWIGISNNGKHDGKIAGPGMMFLESYRQSKPMYESVLQVVSRNTEFLDSAPMQRCLASSNFKLSELKTRKEGLSLYLSLPQRYMADHFRWLRMMVALVVNEMEATPGRPATGHPVLVCLDEFAGLKRMEAIENAVAQIAGFGVKLFFCLQSLEQLKGTYPDKWETFLSNCGLKLFFNLEDHFSREYVSKFVGETEVVRETQSGNESTSNSESTTEGTSESKGHSTSSSHSHSTNTSSSRSQSTSQSRNWGGNSSTTKGDGTSEAHNWGLHPLFFRNTSKFLSLLRNDETTNRGSNRSSSKTKGKSWGESDSASESSSTSHGSGESVSTGTSESFNRGKSHSTTQGSSQSRSEGWSQTVHKRPLITPDELGLYFSAVRDRKSKAYPGLALVLASGQRPLAIRRANYFEDGEFAGYFDVHPDHPDSKPKPLWVEYQVTVPPESGLAVLWEACPAGTRLLLDSAQVWAGKRVKRGEPIANLKFGWRQALSDRPKWFTAELPVPFSGTLTRLACEPCELQPDQELAWIKVNRRQASREESVPISDCIAELATQLEAENARLEQERLAEAARIENERLAKAARLEREELDKKNRRLAYEQRYEAFLAFQNNRWWGLTRRWERSGRQVVMGTFLLTFIVGIVVAFDVMSEAKGFSAKLVAFMATFLFFTVFSGLGLVSSFFVNRLSGFPNVPSDRREANVTVETDGSISVTPAASDGYISPHEAVAFINTALVSERIINEGIRLELPDSANWNEVEITNLALLYHAAKVNRLKIANEAAVYEEIRFQKDARNRAKALWKAALSPSQ